jgi:Gas vesicle synthesis protein GvpL/GvpF
MDDELARWAQSRAPDLIARAEAEAVAILRDALLDAARRPARAAVQPAPRVAAPTSAPTGELMWAYCVLRTDDAEAPDVPGVDGAAVERVAVGGLTALVSRVRAAQFAAEPLRENLNELPWLEAVARAHETVLGAAFAAATIVPLRLCTIYEGADGVRRMLGEEHHALDRALARLHGREEWGVKLLVDPQLLADAARAASPHAATFAQQAEERDAGGAYMLRRRLERHVREQADALASDLAAAVHARLQDWALDAVTRPAQNRDLSGHEGQMLLNGAYLVEAGRAEELRGLADELGAHHRDVGARLELTGPWPPFNFVGAAQP